MKVVQGLSLAAVLCFVLLAPASPVFAQSVIEEWTSVQAPPPPALSKVTVDPQTTALLVLDIVKQTCNAQQRPRCVAMLPQVKKLLAFARTKGLFVVYTLVANSTTADILPEVAMAGGEPVVTAAPDKYVNSQLEEILKGKGIKTVVAIGVAAQGAVLHTAAGSAFRGFNVVVPVDGIAAESTYAEQYTTWDLVNAPRLSGMVKLTKIDMID